MKWLILFLLLNSVSFAQQAPANLGVSFKDESLVKILSDYTHHVRSYNLQSNEAVIVLRLVWAHDDRSEWYFSTFTDVTGLQKSPPVLISEVDFYPVAIYFDNKEINPLLTYSTEYLTYLKEAIYSKFKRHTNLNPARLPNTWRVTIRKGEKTEVLVVI